MNELEIKNIYTKIKSQYPNKTIYELINISIEKFNIKDVSDFKTKFIKLNNLEVEYARELCKEVNELTKKYDLEYFFVTEGASSCHINKNDAVRHARNSHKQWELNNNFDPEEDWSNE